jgi:acetylornithine deacetylase/succinyl-diaminopimelate desuccinylase-like protein
MANELTGATTELLQTLIRNECVNDGTPDSGGEVRNAELLQQYLEGPGVEIEQFSSRPGRTSMVARIEGTDPSAPTLCLMGHTDVVPVNVAGWSQDPFGGELIDGEVWGRGAIDMLNITASMAVSFRELARSGWRPKGTLIYFGVADEEAGGNWGAEWMCEHHWDAIASDYVLTEIGGWSTVGSDDVRRVTVNTGEKGIAWRRLRVTGTPAHGSMPFGADNALIKAAEVVRRLANHRPQPNLTDMWKAQVSVMPLPDDVRAGLLDPARIWETIETLPPPLARTCHAATHTTISPNVVHGGQKTNIIPDAVELDVDIRTVPGTTHADVDAMLHDALGELAHHVTWSDIQAGDPTESPRGNPLWEAVGNATQVAYPGAELLPGLVVGGTDARFFRQKGAIAYGAGLFSPSVTLESFGTRFHGNDERIDVESLGLAGDFWIHIAKEICG